MLQKLTFIPHKLKSPAVIKERALAKLDDPGIVKTAREYGYDYFDGDRKYGYGGYTYDGRWGSVASDLIHHYNLLPGSRVLDIGCAKGFLVHELCAKGMDAYGIDVSHYAIHRCEPAVVGRLHLMNAANLGLFPSHSFDLVVSFNTIHNLEPQTVGMALEQIMRITREGRAFVQVDSYNTPEEKAQFESWVLTAKYHDYPKGWLDTFSKAGYTGDYAWTLV